LKADPTTHKVTQVSVQNCTVNGWPQSGLIPFGPGDGSSPGNYFMVQDGNPLRTTSGKPDEWLLPMYGELMEWELPLNTTHQNQKEPSGVIVLIRNTDPSMEYGARLALASRSP
jgi:hypothetical protein